MKNISEELAKALRYATAVLTRRDHAEGELAAKLGRKGYPEEIVAAVLQKLRGWGYLDDGRFARSRAEAAIRGGKGYGRKIAADLQAKGIDRDLAAEVLQGVTAEYPEEEVLRGVMERKFPRFDSASADDKEKRRVAGYLLRRGFSASAVFSFFREGRD